MRIAWAALALLLLATPTALADIHLQLPERIELRNATLLAGRIDATGLVWQHLHATQATSARLGEGNLTVCPITAARDEATLLELLGALTPNCPQGRTFTGAHVSFGPGTNLLFNGTLAQPGPLGAAMLVPFGDANGTVMALPAIPQLLRAPEFRFLPVTRQTTALVESDQGRAAYNGTGYAYLAATPTLTLAAGGWGGRVPGDLRIRIGSAGAGLSAALRPFDLLEVESALLGADAREPRANVSALFREFGRVPAFLDGAVEGRLSGVVDGNAVGEGLGLLRGHSFDLRRTGATLEGSWSPRTAVLPQGVALAGGAPMGPPWPLAAVLLLGAAAAIALRRATPPRTLALRAGWAGAAVAAFLLVDRFVLARALGTSALGEASRGAAGATLALAAFQACAVTLAYFGIAWPIRILMERTMSMRVRRVAEPVWAALWLLSILLLPAAWFSLGYSVARL